MDRKEAFGTEKLSLLDKIIYRFRIHQLRKYCDFKNKIIADIGCGYNAIFLDHIQHSSSIKKLIAIDIQLNNKVLQKKGIDTFELDINKEFILPEKVDLIICTAVLEHVKKPINFLENAYKNLKEGGSLVLTVPSIRSKPVLEFLAFKLKIINALEIRDHKKYYTKKILMEYLEKVGFKTNNIHHHYFELYMNNFVLAKK